MQQVDASNSVPPDVHTANRIIFVSLLPAAVVIKQVAMLATAHTGRERGLDIALIIAKIILWASRCGR